MKYVKTLGLAAVAAMALMALVGADTASATVLCKTNPANHVCGAANHYEKVVIDGSLEASTIFETIGGVSLDTCKGGTVKGKQVNTGMAGERVGGEIQTLSWAECTNTTDTLVEGILEVEWNEGTHNGSLYSEKTKVTALTVFGTCVYWTGEEGAEPEETLLGTVTGGQKSTIHINTIVTKTAGSAGACPEKIRWTATYKITEPEDPMYVEKE